MKIPAHLNAWLSVGLTAAQLALLWATAHGPAPWLAAPLFGYLGIAIYGLMHEAEHALLQPSRRWNDVCGVLHGWMFGGCFTFLRATHLGHHARNRSDCELFDQYHPGQRLRKTAQFYLLYVGFFWLLVPLSAIALLLCPWLLRSTIVQDLPESAAMANGVPSAYLGRIRLECLGALLWHAGLFVALDLTWWSWAACYACLAFAWSSVNYMGHAGAPRNVRDGAFNLSMPAWAGFAMLHFNWHLAHHQHPTVPWIHLPRHADPARPLRPWSEARRTFWRGPTPVTEPSPRPDLDGA